MKKRSKKPLSKFDLLVEHLIHEFTKIPNIDLLQKDEAANSLFNMMALRVADASSYKELVCAHFIPAVNKAITLSKQDFRQSKYGFLLDPKNLDFDETLYDTIRLAYVGLFHKLENYINELMTIPEKLYPDFQSSDMTVEKWVQERYNFKIRDWKRYFITDKINWICNCVKHYDGYPKKYPKPEGFILCNENEKLKLSPVDFKNDCEMLLHFYPIFFNTIMLMSLAKNVFDKMIPNTGTLGEDNFSVQTQELLSSLDQKIESFMIALNNLS